MTFIKLMNMFLSDQKKKIVFYVIKDITKFRLGDGAGVTSVSSLVALEGGAGGL